MEEKILFETIKYEKMTAELLQSASATDLEIQKVLDEIKEAQIEMNNCKKSFLNTEQGDRDVMKQTRRPGRRVQSLCVPNFIQESNMHTATKSQVGQTISEVKDSWVLDKDMGSNQSTVDQSLIANDKSKLVNNGTQGCTPFKMSARVNKLPLVHSMFRVSGSGVQNSNLARKSIESFGLGLMTPKQSQKKDMDTPIFRVEVSKLLTFSDSSNQIYDPSTVLSEGYCTRNVEALNHPGQRYNSCHKTTKTISAAKMKSKRGVQLPVTFTSLDAILNIELRKENCRGDRPNRINRM